MKRIIALAALILFAMTGTAQAKADDPKDACKHGGFSQYVDPATGQPFTSQSPCVSSVAQGGTLVPVQEAPDPIRIDVTFNNIEQMQIRGYGFTPFEPLTIWHTYPDGTVEATDATAADASGYVMVGEGTRSCEFFPMVITIERTSTGERISTGPYSRPSCP